MLPEDIRGQHTEAIITETSQSDHTDLWKVLHMTTGLPSLIKEAQMLFTTCVTLSKLTFLKQIAPISYAISTFLLLRVDNGPNKQ